MGQKVNPHGLKVGMIKDWDSRWFAEGDSVNNLIEGYNIRKFLKKRLYALGVDDIETERVPGRVRMIIRTAKLDTVIGKQGTEIEKLKKEVAGLTEKEVFIDIKEIKRSDREAQLVAENIAQQLENRASFHRAMESAMQRSIKSDIPGIETCCTGRLGGTDIARSEFYSEGTIPLQTLHADIDYGPAEAGTTYGKVSVKVWIYKDEVPSARVETRKGSAK